MRHVVGRHRDGAVAWRAAATLMALCLALAGVPARAMENETEMTGGFVPIEEVSDALAAEAAEPAQLGNGGNEGSDSEAVAPSASGGGSTGESAQSSQSAPSAGEPLVVELDRPVQPEESVTSAPSADEAARSSDEAARSSDGAAPSAGEAAPSAGEAAPSAGEAADGEAADSDSSLDFGLLALVGAGFVVGLAIVFALVALRKRKK